MIQTFIWHTQGGYSVSQNQVYHCVCLKDWRRRTKGKCFRIEQTLRILIHKCVFYRNAWGWRKAAQAVLQAQVNGVRQWDVFRATWCSVVAEAQLIRAMRRNRKLYHTPNRKPSKDSMQGNIGYVCIWAHYSEISVQDSWEGTSSVPRRQLSLKSPTRLLPTPIPCKYQNLRLLMPHIKLCDMDR